MDEPKPPRKRSKRWLKGIVVIVLALEAFVLSHWVWAQGSGRPDIKVFRTIAQIMDLAGIGGLLFGFYLALSDERD
jgi:hypothetical protein